MNTKDVFDVVIVGAGPGGSSAAYFLSREGARVLLIDQAKFPRDKPCGGEISAHIIEKHPYLLKFMDQPMKKACCHYKEPKYDISIETKEPIAYFVRRIEFDNNLFTLAKLNNIQALEQSRVKQIKEEKDLVKVLLEDGTEYSAKFVIGADGVGSIVRRCTKLEKYWRKDTLGLAFVKEFLVQPEKLDKLYSKDRTSHIHFGFGAEDKYGYGWIFVKSKSINVGYGEIKKSEPKEMHARFQNYIDYCCKNNLLPSEDVPKITKSHRLQINGPMKKTATTRILLIGDAAGYDHAVTGEGISFAIWSGFIAANSISEYLHKGGSIKEVSTKFQKTCKKEFADNLKKVAFAARFMERALPILFQLSRFDEKIKHLEIAVITNSLPLNKIVIKLFYRMIVNFFKGNYWKQ